MKIWYSFVCAKEYKQEHTDYLLHKPLQWQELLPVEMAVPPVTTLKDSATHRSSFISVLVWWALYPVFPPSHCHISTMCQVVPWVWVTRDSNYGAEENKNLKGSPANYHWRSRNQSHHRGWYVGEAPGNPNNYIKSHKDTNKKSEDIHPKY